ncbi:MAG: hypothetical protein LBD97_06195 [Bifidobacteriaceae bacterium]|jgi:hypothetical protein|nr:hypothetical protein [Bifidobacteriaceae bacterium]
MRAPVLAAAAAVVFLLAGVVVTSPAAADDAAGQTLPDAGRGAAGDADVVLTVNSDQFEEAGSDCANGGVCTLRRAILVANAVDQELDVRIEAGVDGTILFPTKVDNLMTRAAASPFDTAGAAFHVTRPMEIDLGDRLRLVPASGDAPSATAAAAAMLVDAPGVTLRNFSGWFSYQSVFVFSADSDGSSLVGGESIQEANYHTNRQVVIMAGAEDISISGYTMGRQANEAGAAGIAITRFASDSAAGPVKRVAITGVTFDNTNPTSATCSNSNGTGCSANGLHLSNDVAVDGLTLRNSKFVNFWRTTGSATLSAINAAGGGALSNWDVTENQFTDTRNGSATILLPTWQDTRKELPGPFRIHANVFDNSRSPAAQAHAVYLEMKRALGSTEPSGLFIEDNYFDGYSQTINLKAAGTVTVSRNTFGPNTSSAASPGDAEESGTASGIMFTNNGRGANRGIRTFWPNSATANGCALTIDVRKTTAGADLLPDTPFDLDVYWTQGTTAELYLGTLKGLQTEGVYTLDATTPAGGGIRLQTQSSGSAVAQPESSQYSRIVGVNPSGVCSPAVAVALHAWTDVPQDATDYDSVVNSTATQLDRGAIVTAGADIWFTYTVTNIGTAKIEQVLVSDDQAASVCVITQLRAGESAGCARRADPV